MPNRYLGFQHTHRLMRCDESAGFCSDFTWVKFIQKFFLLKRRVAHAEHWSRRANQSHDQALKSVMEAICACVTMRPSSLRLLIIRVTISHNDSLLLFRFH